MLQDPKVKIIVRDVILILFVCFAGYGLIRNWSFLFSKFGGYKTTIEKPALPKVTTVKAVDMSKVPEAFPKGMPLEIKNIIQNSTSTYAGFGFQHYTVTYSSTMSVSAKYDQYLKYLKGAGYALDPKEQNKTAGVLVGRKSNDTLSVVLESKDSKTLVHLILVRNQ